MTIGQDTCIPGKRLRNWHRQERPQQSLRAFVRALANLDDTQAQRDRAVVARAWLIGKRIRPVANEPVPEMPPGWEERAVARAKREGVLP